jgi:hypothetical protein
MYNPERVVIERSSDNGFSLSIASRPIVLLNSWLIPPEIKRDGTWFFDISKDLGRFLRAVALLALPEVVEPPICEHKIIVDTTMHLLPTEKIVLTNLYYMDLHHCWIFYGGNIDTSSDIIFYLLCLEKYFPIEVRYTVFSLLLLL